jgi:hypothetical protein
VADLTSGYALGQQLRAKILTVRYGLVGLDDGCPVYRERLDHSSQNPAQRLKIANKPQPKGGSRKGIPNKATGETKA